MFGRAISHTAATRPPAVTLLREAIRRNYCASAAIDIDPMFDSIRHHAEYAELSESSCVRAAAEPDCMLFSARQPSTERVQIMTTKRFLAAVVLIGLSTGIVLAQSTNPLVGTWKLNVEKSKAPFKSGATTIEAVGEGIKFMVDLVGADGTKNHWEFTANFDGKDAPVKGENPYGDTVALTRVDARTIRIVNKYQGKPTTTHTIVVSADGKTRTTTAKGPDKTGKPTDAVSFYEKQ